MRMRKIQLTENLGQHEHVLYNILYDNNYIDKSMFKYLISNYKFNAKF